MTNLSEKFAQLQQLIDQVEQLQGAANTTLAAILSALGQQPSPVPVLEQISITLDQLLVSVRRIEQFIAPVEQVPPSGTEAGIAYELARLARVAAGPPGTPQSAYYIQDLFEPLIDVATPAITNSSLSVGRICDAIWPFGDTRPGKVDDDHRSLYWLMYRMLYWMSLEYPAVGDAKNVITALFQVNDSLDGIYDRGLAISTSLGSKVQNKSAIQWLSEIADCNCGNAAPAPGVGGCVQPEISAGAKLSGDRTWGTWGGTGPIFALGVVAFAEGSMLPSGVALTSNSWSVLSVYVSSRRAAYWSTGSEDGTLYPTNEWLAVPADDGGNFAVAVGVGQDLTVYLCAEAAQPPPPAPGFTALSSAGGTVLDPQGVPLNDPVWGSYGYAINSWSVLGVTSRVRNSESGYTHDMIPGSYADLDVAYEMYSNVAWKLFVGSGGFVADIAAGEHRVVGPATNVSCARPEGNFTLYARIAPSGLP